MAQKHQEQELLMQHGTEVAVGEVACTEAEGGETASYRNRGGGAATWHRCSWRRGAAAWYRRGRTSSRIAQKQQGQQQVTESTVKAVCMEAAAAWYISKRGSSMVQK